MPRSAETFDQMEASLLFCPRCREATPVRKRLLLVLPEGEKFDYVCSRCGSLCGDKIERPAPPVAEMPLSWGRPAPRPLPRRP